MNIKLIENLTVQKDLNYLIYKSPVGELFLLGDNDSLKALIFYNHQNKKLNLKKCFKIGMNDSLNKTSLFLDSYFQNALAHPVYDISLVYAIDKNNNSSLRKIIEQEKINKGYNQKVLKLDIKSFTIPEFSVYSSLLEVKSGETISYNDLSARSRIPRGARFVGNAMAKNIFPLLIPCHRVIKSDGTIGNYGGGIKMKEFLLAQEGRL